MLKQLEMPSTQPYGKQGLGVYLEADQENQEEALL
jgi:hypothetical protein